MGLPATTQVRAVLGEGIRQFGDSCLRLLVVLVVGGATYGGARVLVASDPLSCHHLGVVGVAQAVLLPHLSGFTSQSYSPSELAYPSLDAVRLAR